jgi:hypothetical protein
MRDYLGYLLFSIPLATVPRAWTVIALPLSMPRLHLFETDENSHHELSRFLCPL